VEGLADLGAPIEEPAGKIFGKNTTIHSVNFKSEPR